MTFIFSQPFNLDLSCFKKNLKSQSLRSRAWLVDLVYYYYFFDKTSIKTLEKKKNHTEVAILIMKFEEVWFGY